MGTQIQTIQKMCRENVRIFNRVGSKISRSQIVQKRKAFFFFCVSMKTETLLLLILKFNVNVTIPIANIEECRPCLVTTADWSNRHILVSDWLIDIPLASGQNQNSFLTGTKCCKKKIATRTQHSPLWTCWLYKDCNRDKK